MSSALSVTLAAVVILSAMTIASAYNRFTLVAQEGAISVAFRAFASDGSAALDLNQDELSVTIGGEKRRLLSLELVSKAEGRGAALPPPFVSNASPAPRRRMLLYVDEESLNPGDQGEVQAAIDHLLGQMRADDSVGLSSMRAAGVTVAPTADRERLRRTAASLSGLRSSTNRCVFPDIVRQLHVLFQSLPSDTLTTVVLFTGGVNLTFSCDSRRIREDVSQAGRAAQAGALDFYIVHVFSRSGETGDPAFLQDLAGASNGVFLRLAAGRTDSLAPIVGDTAAYYIARVAVDGAGRNGGMRRLELETTRRDIRIRSQDWIRIAEETSAAPGVTAVSDILQSPADWRALPLRARTLVAPNPGDRRVRLLTLFQSAEEVPLSAAMIGVFESDGTTAAQWSARASELKAPLTLAAMPVPPGRYRVRVAAASADGRVGTVDEMVEAPRPEDGMVTSSLLLALLNQGSLAPVLEFGSEPEATAYLEISGAPETAALEVRLALLDGAGTPVLEPVVATLKQGATEGVRIAHAQLQLASLGDGDYLVLATVLDGSKLVATRQATLRKRLR